MSRFEAWLTHAATLLVGGTGLVYAWMRYALEPADPYAVVQHPWEPAVQHLHLLTAPLLVFAIGVIWRRHVWKHYRERVPARRRSGLTLLITAAPMIASGYLLQTAVDDAWRRAWLVVHLSASALWLLGYLGHQIATLRNSRNPSRRQGDEGPRAASPKRLARPGPTPHRWKRENGAAEASSAATRMPGRTEKTPVGRQRMVTRAKRRLPTLNR